MSAMPLRSRFPGELALRDLPAAAPHRLANLVTARMLVLQLAERVTGATMDLAELQREVEAVRPYIDPVRERFPADAMRLERALDRIAAGDPRRAAAALLAAGDSSTLHGHMMGAYGYYYAAYDLGVASDGGAAALSAASRLRDVAQDMGREQQAEKWDKRARRLVQRCR